MDNFTKLWCLTSIEKVIKSAQNWFKKLEYVKKSIKLPTYLTP